MPNGSLKIFDSHARDSFGMAQPHGTCVLLEVTSVDHLVGYFKTCYRGNVLYEMKGVIITIASEQSASNTSNNQEKSNELMSSSSHEATYRQS